MGRLSRTMLMQVAAAGPGVLLGLMSVAWLLMAVVNEHPFWPEEPLTLSEAAALRDGGEVARLLGEGQDPNARYPIRPGFLFSHATIMTPVEAAAAADRPEILAILEGAGARPPESIVSPR